MINSKLKKVFLSIVLVTTALLADASSGYTTQSLIGIEGGVSSVDYVYNNANSPQSAVSTNLGLKVGAETRDFRVFLSGRYFYDSSNSSDYIVTYGGEIQYKFNAFDFMNFFIGANGGMANIRFSPVDGSPYRTLSSAYFGGDLGANIHLGKSMDLELGGRVMSIQDTNTINSIEYRFNDIVTGYVSVIFKWQMD